MVAYFIAFLITVIVEFFVFWLVIREYPLKLLFYSIIINLLTFPLANYAFQELINSLFFIEVLVVVVESILVLLLFRVSYSKALVISAVANAATTLLGYMLFW